jgi:hypothetical protein
MVVQVVQKIHAAIKVVEKSTAQAETAIEELDRSNERATEDVLQPGQSLESVS